MLFQTLWDGTEQLTLWKWTEFDGSEMGRILFVCLFVCFKLICLPVYSHVCLIAWSVFFAADGQRMYFHHVLSMSMCKESKDKLCYSDVLAFRPLNVCFMQTAVFFVELRVFKFTSCHSNQSSHFLLFIVDCNNSDNHKKVQQIFLFPLTQLVCVIMAFTNLLKLMHSVFTRYFCKCPSTETFLVKPFCAESVTLTCAFPFLETSSRF